MTEHRWSGWPGAVCLVCGCEDQREVCVSEHDVLLTCIKGHFMCTACPEGPVCHLHKNPPCVEIKTHGK